MIRIGVLGVGYWGPNLVRNFSSVPGCEVAVVCDRDIKRLKQISGAFPSVHTVTEAAELFAHGLDAVVVATPAKTHYALAKEAIERGLHTFVEKPLATTSAECRELIQLADAEGVVLFVGHVFLYTPPVAKLKEIISRGDLGDVCYISSTRLNLGLIRRDVSVLWDLAPHDVSIILELLGELPQSASCAGLAYLNESVHEVCNLSLHFENKCIGLIHVSWLDPHKRRVMTVVGSKRMAVYDDMEPLEKVKIYDRGIDVPANVGSLGDFQYSYRYGDSYSPCLTAQEPLRVECQSFVDSIVNGSRPKTDGRNGLRVVQVLEAADHSLHNGGGRVSLDPPDGEEDAYRHPDTLAYQWR